MEKSENEKEIIGKIHLPAGVIIVAVFMILAGLAEVFTAFRHNFFGITTSTANLFTYSSVIIGAFYTIAGLLILTMKQRAAKLAILLVSIDVIGRIILVVTGLYPTDSFKNTLSIIAGTVIVAIIIIYIMVNLKSFR